MEKKYTGIVASQGIAIGKAYIFEQAKYELTKGKIDNDKIHVEIDKIRKAIESYHTELENAKVTSDEASLVIEAHKELLQDPYLIQTIESKIEDDNLPSDMALQETITEMVTMMASLDDEYLKERATDYKDIGQKVMYKLKGIEVKDLSNLDDKYIIISEELTPSDTSTMQKENVLGFAMDLGGKTSHTSIIAQTLSIPAIVGMKEISKNIKHLDLVILDAQEGKLIVNPTNETVNLYEEKLSQLNKEAQILEQFKDKDAITSDGRKIEVVCNIGNLDDLTIGLDKGAKGVGLFRTEFLYMESKEFPSEQVQFEVYKQAAQRLEGKPLIIRTLDIGGDKELSYFAFPKEENPFLGWRALRMCFDMTDIFKTQIRAILRASAFGNVKFLLPMIISVSEIKRVQAMIAECKEELKAKGIEFDENIEVGIMVETPASVLLAHELIKYCDFFSIGTNDLTQYTLAVDRGNEKIAHMYNNFHPAVLRAIKMVIDASHAAGKWTGMCGGMASDTNATILLLGMGLDEFSAVGSKIGKIKSLVSNISYEDARKFADEVLEKGELLEIENLLNNLK